jgi:outer membrane protein
MSSKRLIGVVVLTTSAWLTSGAALAAGDWTLERVIEQVLRDNPDARMARERIAAARAGMKQARAAFWPRVQLESSYTYTNNPVMAFGAILNQKAFGPDIDDFNDVPAVDNFNVRGSLMLPLFVGGSNLAGNASAKAQAQAAKHGAEAVRRALSFAAARAFFTVKKVRSFEQAAEAAVRAFERNQEISQKRFNAGTLLKADVLQVEVRLAQAREELVRARNARRLAQHALRNLLGLDSGELTLDRRSPELTVPKTDAPARRSELAAAEQQVRSAEAAIRRAKGSYWPRVDGVASLGYDAGLEREGDNVSYMAGVQLRWQVWDGLATQGRVAQARAALRMAREQQRKLRLALDLELTRARIRLEEASERLAVSEKSIAQAEQSVKLTRARFEQGLALATQLLDAETALTAARVRRAESQADKSIAISALRKALGLPQIETKTPSTKGDAK